MADKINYNDVFEPDVLSGITKLKTELKELGAVMSETFKQAKDASKSTSDQIKLQLEAEKQNTEAIKNKGRIELELTKTVEDAKRKAYAKQLEAEKQLLKEQQKKQQAIDKEIQKERELIVLSNKTNITKKEQARLLTLLINKYDNLTASERNNVNIGGKLLKTIQQQDVELKKLDATTGRFQRQVGNYEIVAEKLKEQLNQLKGSEKALNQQIKQNEIGFNAVKKAQGGATASVNTNVAATYKQSIGFKNLKQQLDTTQAEIRQTELELNKLNSTSGKSDSAFKTIGKGMAQYALTMFGVVGAITTVTGFLKSSFASFMEAEEAAKLTDYAFGAYSETVKKASSETQKLTKVGDEGFQRLAIQAKNFGIANNKVIDSVNGAIGLAEKFKTAGLSEETALKGVALAAEGNWMALTRYIPQLKEASTQTDKMAILQREMASGFDLAKESAQSQSGQLIQAGNLWDDFKERVGEVMSATLQATGVMGGFKEMMIRTNDVLSSETLPLWAKLNSLFTSGGLQQAEVFKGFQTGLERLAGTDAGWLKLQNMATDLRKALDTEHLTTAEKIYRKLPHMIIDTMQKEEQLKQIETALATEEKKRYDNLLSAIQPTTEAINDETEATDKNTKAKYAAIDPLKYLQAQTEILVKQLKLTPEAVTPTTQEIIDLTTACQDAAKAEEELAAGFDEVKMTFWENIKAGKSFEFSLGQLVGLSEEEVSRVIDAGGQLINELKTIYNTIIDMRIDAIDRELEASKKKQTELEKILQEEQQQQKAGAASSIKTIQQQLSKEKQLYNDSLQEKKKLQKQQAIVNGLSQASSIVTAIANAIEGYSKIPIVGVILGIAAAASLVATFLATKANVEKSTGYAEGIEYVERGKNPKGKDTIPAWLDEGERIINAEQNSKIPKGIKNNMIPPLVDAGMKYYNLLSGDNIVKSIIVNDYEKMILEQKKTINEQRRTNELLSKFIFISEDGKTIVDINGNRKKYV